ncbi:MAG: hypothetical protein GPJ29_07335 [Microcystis aeruginosa BK11-02]|nr:hypothetical protein [Microcystis aeruginosa BK11-02]
MSTGIAILGVGRWGVHFVRHFSQHPSAQVVAIVDPSPEKLHLCRDQLNLDTNKVIWFFVTWYGSIGGHKSTKSLSGKVFN